MNYLTFEDPAAINLVRRALKLAQAGDLYGAAETASVEVGHAAVVSDGLRRGMRYSIGAEVDNDPRCRPDAQNIVDAMKPDGMVRSVHFLTIDHPTHGPNWNWPFDNPEFADVFETVGAEKTWELYMATLLDAVERLPGNIVGHFYVPALFGHWPDDATLGGYEDAIVDACDARGMAIELNTRFLYRPHSDEDKAKYIAAHRRLLAKCKAKNVGVAIGSDAHSPKDQGRAFATVLALLDECGINELVFPIAGRLARVALRIERKVEPMPEVLPAPVEDRKPPRKPRLSDDATRQPPAAALITDEAAVPAKAKPRPKRSRAKTPMASETTATATSGSLADDAETRVMPPAAIEPDVIEPDVIEPDVIEPDVIEPDTVDRTGLGPLAEVAESQPPAIDAASGPKNGAVSGSGQAVAPQANEDAEPEFERSTKLSKHELHADSTDNSDEQVVAAQREPAEALDHESAETAGTAPGEVAGTTAAKVAEHLSAHPASDGPAAAPSSAEPVDETAIDETAIVETVIDETTGSANGTATDDLAAETGLDGPPEPIAMPITPPRRRPAPKSKPPSGKVKTPASAATVAKKASKPTTKSIAKSSAKKVEAKKSAAKKPVGKKPPQKKAAAKKAVSRATGSKKSAAKKSATKKNPGKKPAPRRR